MSNQHIGSSFDDFLAEEALLEEATATAMKRVIAWQGIPEANAGGTFFHLDAQHQYAHIQHIERKEI